MKYIEDLCQKNKVLSNIKSDIICAYDIIKNTFENNKKILLCGNGGSASDCAHIVGELMKGFKNKRAIDKNTQDNIKYVINDLLSKNNVNNYIDKYDDMLVNLEQGLPAIDLTSFVSLNTAYINDKNPLYVYANAVLGLGMEQDTLICISTSGNAKNVLNAAIVAKAKKMNVVALTGKNGGDLKNISDVSIVVPLDETYAIQEEHISIYHAICLDIENYFFEEKYA